MFGHLDNLNFGQSEGEQFIMSILPSKCIKIHVNDMNNLPRDCLLAIRDRTYAYPTVSSLDQITQSHQKKEQQNSHLIRSLMSN